jgi:hypothetical protein
MRPHRFFYSLFTGLAIAACIGSSVSRAQTGLCATVVPGQPLPDLIVDAQRLRSDLVLSVENFARTACAVVEGCVTSRGAHVLLRFTSATPNVGQGDLVIGDPNQCSNLFEQSACHNHLHFKQYADYRLWTEVGYNSWVQLRDLTTPTNTGYNATLLANAVANGDLLVGRKQGFCMIDIVQYLPNASPQKRYTLCGSPDSPGNQGLQVGWSDVYGQQLDCQYIQIDGLADGIYVLEDHVNPEQLLPESDYTNNTAIVKFRYIPAKGKKAGQLILQN